MPPLKPGRAASRLVGVKQAGSVAVCPLRPLYASSLSRPTKPRSSTQKPLQPDPSPRESPVNETPRPPPNQSVPTRAITLSAFFVFALSAYGSYLYVNYKKSVEASKTLNVPHDVSDRYNKTAKNYDAEVDLAEKMMRLGKRRKELVQRAKGNVLEVSCGTGRNMEYYILGERRGMNKQGRAEIQGCRTVTFVDQSSEMVEIAKLKFQKLHPNFKLAAFRAQDAGTVEGIPTLSSSAGEEGTAEVKLRKFDTVIQTMGVCSHPDPVSLLKHLGQITEPERGQILLLEHGRSHYSWLNHILDNLAPAHADKHGCWWNRDIGEIVRQSGLEVVESERWHLGTTWQFVLRPRTVQQSAAEEPAEQARSTSDGDVKRGSWITWTSPKST
ncbi:hypothetical protein VTO42DRAFT_4745 [Malbranchea cinnamomea]